MGADAGFVEGVYRVRQDERMRLAGVFVHASASIASVVVATAVANAVYLSRLDPAWVPWRYPISGVAVLGATFVWWWLVGRVRRDRVLVGFHVAAGIAALALWMAADAPWTPVVLWAF